MKDACEKFICLNESNDNESDKFVLATVRDCNINQDIGVVGKFSGFVSM